MAAFSLSKLTEAGSEISLYFSEADSRYSQTSGSGKFYSRKISEDFVRAGLEDFLIDKKLWNAQLASDFTRGDLIKRADSGQPYFCGEPPLSFSLSHSENLFILAVSDVVNVGIDIQLQRPFHADLWGRICTTEELAHSDRSSQRFFSLWTIKESVLKALGLGFQFSPQNIEADFLNQSEPPAFTLPGFIFSGGGSIRILSPPAKIFCQLRTSSEIKTEPLPLDSLDRHKGHAQEFNRIKSPPIRFVSYTIASKGSQNWAKICLCHFRID